MHVSVAFNIIHPLQPQYYARQLKEDWQQQACTYSLDLNLPFMKDATSMLK